MKKQLVLGLLAAAFGGLAATGAGCASSGSSTTGTGGNGGGETNEDGGSSNNSSTSNTASSASTTASSTASGTSTASSTASSTSSSTSSSSSTGGGGPTGASLLISEIGTGVEDGGNEFIELYNATTAELDLSEYFIADSSAYVQFAASGAFAPQGTPNTDFLAGFPAGTKLAAGATLVLATSPKNFEKLYGFCPEFALTSTAIPCESGTTPKSLTAPVSGSIGSQFGSLLSNGDEMVVLFQVDSGAKKVLDVDYVLWGSGHDANNHADKTGQAGYAADTALAAQKAAAAPGKNQSIERCDVTEPGEKTSGGNGVSGSDETSEDLSIAFSVQSKPTPGKLNECLK